MTNDCEICQGEGWFNNEDGDRVTCICVDDYNDGGYDDIAQDVDNKKVI